MHDTVWRGILNQSPDFQKKVQCGYGCQWERRGEETEEDSDALLPFLLWGYKVWRRLSQQWLSQGRLRDQSRLSGLSLVHFYPSFGNPLDPRTDSMPRLKASFLKLKIKPKTFPEKYVNFQVMAKDYLWFQNFKYWMRKWWFLITESTAASDFGSFNAVNCVLQCHPVAAAWTMIPKTSPATTLGVCTFYSQPQEMTADFTGRSSSFSGDELTAAGVDHLK